MIYAVNSCNKNTSMKGTRGQFSTHTPKPLSFEEFHFQPELKDKKFSVKSLIKSIFKTCKEICDVRKNG